MPTKRKLSEADLGEGSGESDYGDRKPDITATKGSTASRQSKVRGDGRKRAPKVSWSEDEINALWMEVYALAKANAATIAKNDVLKAKGRNPSGVANKLEQLFKAKGLNAAE